MSKKTEKKRQGKPIHDHFFRETYGEPAYALDLFRLVLSEKELSLFDLESLTPEIATYIDDQGHEKRADLIYSIQFKGFPGHAAKVIFIFEHKSAQDPRTAPQLLGYQTAIYQRQRHLKERYPIISILVYQGKNPWRAPMGFQDYLFEGYPDKLISALQETLGGSIINFTFKFLNIYEINIDALKNNLKSAVILCSMQEIWNSEEDKDVIGKVFLHAKRLSPEERKVLLGRAASYFHQYNPAVFTREAVQEIEERFVNEEDRVMPALLDEVREEGRAEGREEGRAEGKEEGKEEGREEGRAEGKEEGREEGREEGITEVALRMLEEGTDVHLVSRLTRLDIKKVRKLSQEVKK